jgi:hypothetical protein
VTEDVRQFDHDDVAVLFSILNTADDGRVIVNDIRLHTVLVEDLGTPNYQQERVDLGVVFIVDDRVTATKLDLLGEVETHLLSDRQTIEVPAASSTSLQFRVTNSASEHHMRFVFALIIEYFDDSGDRGRAVSRHLFTLETSDLGGISLSEMTLLSTAALEQLRTRQGNTIRVFSWIQ